MTRGMRLPLQSNNDSKRWRLVSSRNGRNRDWLLWLDCVGGLLVGALVLCFHSWLSQIEGLPASTVVVMGGANLVYGFFSLFVTTRRVRPARLIQALAVANMFWLVVCVGVVVVWWDVVTLLGVSLIVGEGLYVATLGAVEWLWRDHLA